ncbi:MAG: alpha/beta fold hydrolase, partial [Pseudomonadota bacterium]
RALGYETWTIFGVSYGTELGQVVMQVDRDGLRAAVLDSVVPLVVPIDDPAFTATLGFRSSLATLDAMCAADTACARKFEAISDDFIQAFKDFDESPVLLEDLSPQKAVDGQVLIDGTTAAGAVFLSLYRKELYQDMPAILRALETKDIEVLRLFVDQLGYSIDHSFGHGLSWVAGCKGSILGPYRREATTAAAEQEPDLSKWMGFLSYGDVCSQVHAEPFEPFYAPLVSDIPTLVVSGDADPITPPSYARTILPGLSNHTYVEFPHTGHGGLLSNFDLCGRRLLRDFIVDPTRELNRDCVTETPAPDFLVRLRETKAPYRFLTGLQRGEYPRLAIAALAALALTLVAFPATALARRLDRSGAGRLGRARLLSWTGSALSLGGVAWALSTMFGVAANHATALPIGVPPAIGWAGWLSAAGALLAIGGAVQAFRYRVSAQARIGTLIWISVAAASTAWIFWWLAQVGAGPL